VYENVGLTAEDLAILLHVYGHHVCIPGAPQILDSAHIVAPSRCHRTELRRRHDGRQPSRFLHNVFVWQKMSDDIDDHTKQKRSPHDGTRWAHDGLTMGQIGHTISTRIVISQYHRQIFDMPKIIRPLTMVLTKPYKLSQRSNDVTICSHEWCDIVTIRTEFDFVCPIVSISGQCDACINVSTELEMTPNARQNGGKARCVKHCKCA